MKQTYYTVTKQNPPFAMNKCKNFSIFTAAILFEKVKTLHRIPLIFFFQLPSLIFPPSVLQKQSVS